VQVGGVVVEVDSGTGPGASMARLVGCGEEPGLPGTGDTDAA